MCNHITLLRGWVPVTQWCYRLSSTWVHLRGGPGEHRLRALGQQSEDSPGRRLGNTWGNGHSEVCSIGEGRQSISKQIFKDRNMCCKMLCHLKYTKFVTFLMILQPSIKPALYNGVCWGRSWILHMFSKTSEKMANEHISFQEFTGFLALYFHREFNLIWHSSYESGKAMATSGIWLLQKKHPGACGRENIVKDLFLCILIMKVIGA